MKSAVALMFLALLAPAAAQAIGLPSATRPLPAADLKAIYAGKTLSLGRAHLTYFAPDGTLLAAQQNGNGITTTGVWRAGDSGRLCYEAAFSSAADIALNTPPTRVVQCWDHQLQANGVLFRRDMGDGSRFRAEETNTGDWSVFRSATPRPTDPVNQQLQPGDAATPVIKAVTAAAATPPGDKPEFGTQLKGAAIQAALAGRITKATLLPGLGPTAGRRISFDATGKAFIESSAGSNRTRATGTAAVRGDYLCLHVPLTQPERCFFVYKSGDNAFSFLFPDLTLNSNFEIEQAALS
jgi:hypothetical protein